MVLREHNDPLNQSRGIMGPLGNSAVQNNRGRLRQRFDLIRKLGQGTYGKVQLGIDKETGQEVAIKTIKKSKIETEADLIRIRREIQIMSSVRHPNIIHIYEVFENREKMVLVMEYAAGGELYDYLNDRKILQEDEARRIFRQIASATYYCHKHKICHRDLKLENILLDEGSNAKIADFGLSNVFDDVNLLKTFCGSPLYASPEIVRGTPYYGPEVDCWSLGVLLYTLVYGAMPFDGSNFKRLVKQISQGDYYEPKKPAEASNLIRRMLTVDPVKRASIKDVCAHQWINQGFEKQCLNTAEDLANQTPVRLDVLLSVAPAYNINHVISDIQGDDESTAGPSGAAAAGHAGASSSSVIAEPKKAKKDSQQAGSSKPVAAPFDKPARPSLAKEKQAQPKEVKRKAAVKKKSKSSPVLELIVDEEEEMDREPLEVIEGGPEDDDDAGDTLSEISEIQTIAEDIKDMAKSKSKLKIKPEEPKKEQPKEPSPKPAPKEDAPKKDANSTVEETEPTPAAPAVVKEVRKKSKTEEPAKVIENKEEPPPPKKTPEPKDVVQDKKPEKPVSKKTEDVKPAVEASSVPATTKPAEEAETASKPSEATSKPPAVVKKKLVKRASVDKGESKGEDDKNKSSTKSLVNSSTTGSSSSLASSAGGKSGTKLDKEPKSEAGSKTKLRARSDSNSSDASPTRIERRNSKVISQKTAELIQNLETKQSLSSTDKPKKLMFPSLKVSDAKRAFEKPPKPVLKEPTSPPTKKSSPPEDKPKPKAEVKKKKEDKPEGSELTVEKPKKSKSKSPSPVPDETKQKPDKQTESKTVEVKEQVAEPNKPEVKPTKPKEVVKDQPTKPAEKVKDKEPEKPASLSPAGNQTEQKQKSVSPKPTKKLTKPAFKEEMPKPAPSPEPLSEMTISDSLNTEIDRPVPEAPKKTTPKPLKKLKIPAPSPSPVPNPDQLVKPVLVDNGTGPPKQAVMLMSGKTTPPVKNTADLDTSMSTDPYFSQSESVPASSPADNKVKPTAGKAQEKQQAAKKISSVISRIASSESAERIMNEEKKGKKVVKTEVEKFVNAPDKPKTQRTEVSFPVAAAPSAERIIPIRFVSEAAPSTPPSPATPLPHGNIITQSSKTQSAPNISRIPPRKSVDASSSTLFSRQNSSDTESSIAPPKPEPIRKSPREFIIPIKLETSGQTLTPRDDASEASQSEDPFRMDSRLRSGRFGRHKRYSSLLSDSSLEEEPAPATSVSASTSRRSSTATAPCHTRSHSQGDEPDQSTAPVGTFRKYRMRRSGGVPLDRSDSFSSAEEDEEDAFEVLTAESLFSSLLDRVRNLTKRINRDDGPNPNWQGPESPGFMFGSANPFREFMSRAPSETRTYTSAGPAGSYTMTRSFSREPSVTVTISTGPTWRRSLSREMSGDSDSASAFSEPQSASIASNNPPSRSGSVFHSRGSSFAGVDPMDTCTVRSLPLNLGSSRRTPFMSQRSEPHGIPDSSLSSSTYNPPTARPYGRTMSNTDFNTSVTLPFRRSVKTYDRPTTNYGHSDYGGDAYSSSSSLGYGPPSRSNSLMHRYTGSSSNSVASAGGIPSDPSYSRFGRSMSRVRTTPDTDMQRFRDLSSSRQIDNPLLSSYRNPSGESNGWVGGSNSSSVKTAAATAKMTTQEKMNNYQNFYQGLSQNPLRSFPESTSPTPPFLETFTDNFASPNSAFVRPCPSPSMYETSFVNNNNSQFINPMEPVTSPSNIIRPVKPVSPNRSFTTRELSSPPMMVHTGDASTPSNIPKWPNISIKTHRPVNVANFSDTKLNNPGAPSDTPNVSTPVSVHTSRSIPSILNRQSVEKQPSSAGNISGSILNRQSVEKQPSFTGNISGSILNRQSVEKQPSFTGNVSGTNLNRQSVEKQQSPTGTRPAPGSHQLPHQTITSPLVTNVSVALMRPQNPTTFRVLSPPPYNPSAEISSSNPPANQSVYTPKIPRRDARATSVEKITRLLERKSMPRERVVSPPPSQLSPPPSHFRDITPTSDTISPSSTLTLKSEEDPSDRSLNASPEKTRNVSTSNSLQRITKPKFIQSLEKKWEKLTTSSPQIPDNKTKTEITVSTQLKDDSDESEKQTKPDSESMLLQRAVSPEKKLKSKFGASTVNYMLGKFKRFEESSSGSKIPAGKPPAGGLAGSKIGRRVQSVYAGACSDSVLALPRENSVSRSIMNGVSDEDKNETPPVKSRMSPRLERALTTNITCSTDISTSLHIDCPGTGDSKNKPSLITRRPVSFGMFSGSNINAASTTSTPSTPATPSLIPRLNRSSLTPQRTIPAPTPETTDIAKTPVNDYTPSIPAEAAPQIHIIPDSKSFDDGDDNLLTPTSISDSFDSSSICSEKTEMSMKSVLDDEESVSDRIFRKSFYPRFNSLDRKKSKSTPSNPRHYTPKPKTPTAARSSSPSNHVIEHTSSMITSMPLPGNINETHYSEGTTPSPTPSGLSSKINKYNPNPLFKELITDDFKSEVGSKAEYSRRVTSKLSKLLKEIESDIGNSGATTSNHTKDMTNNFKNSLSTASSTVNGKTRKSLSPSPGRFIDSGAQQQITREKSPSNKNNMKVMSNSDSMMGENGKL